MNVEKIAPRREKAGSDKSAKTGDQHQVPGLQERIVQFLGQSLPNDASRLLPIAGGAGQQKGIEEGDGSGHEAVGIENAKGRILVAQAPPGLAVLPSSLRSERLRPIDQAVVENLLGGQKPKAERQPGRRQFAVLAATDDHHVRKVDEI